MTEPDPKEITKYLVQVRRGLLQAAKGIEVLAKYIDLCYSNNEHIEFDENDEVSITDIFVSE